jgi:hypothetical protein
VEIEYVLARAEGVAGLVELPAADHNLRWLMLTHPVVRERLDEWESHAKRLVVQGRTLRAGKMKAPHIQVLVVDQTAWLLGDTSEQECRGSWTNSPNAEWPRGAG